MRRVQIGFLLASDGQPWVWVMGEHRDDLPYEELVRRREREEAEREMLAEQQDRREAEQLAKKETRDVLSLARETVEFRVPIVILVECGYLIFSRNDQLFWSYCVCVTRTF